MDTFAARYFGSLSASVREKMESGLQVFIQLLHQIHGWTAQTTQTAGGLANRQRTPQPTPGRATRC